ncbi:MAG: hypothetical protein NC131_04825 [Roseburia sp.]|nr:hypothetical protein [Roseburia sp.]
MHDFCYVSKKKAAPVKADLLDLIREVQDIVRDKFTFQYRFIGSASRNMITYDTKSNIGYDFDVNFDVNDDDENFTPKQIRTIIRNAINEVAPNHGYDYCEDSTRVLTIKQKDYRRAKILHSCDFAIVFNGKDGQQYIRYNKDNGNYSWEFQGEGFEELPEKIDWLKDNDLWGDLLDYYIEKKNRNNNPNKHSRSIFAESVNETCQKNGYNE